MARGGYELAECRVVIYRVFGVGRDSATNVLARCDATIDALSMQARECPSALDGKPVVALTYGASGPIPWRWVTDELRALDDRTLLGMTRIDLPVLRHMVFPFLLERAA